MKILLDNCIPRPFERHFPGHEVVHCSRLGWEQLANGKLLAAAEQAGFEVLVTVDQGIQHQQNMNGRQVAVINLRVRSNSMEKLIPMASLVITKLLELQPGQVIILNHPDIG